MAEVQRIALVKWRETRSLPGRPLTPGSDEFDLVKTLLLFFDGIGLSGHNADRAIDASPELLTPLADRNLIHIIDEQRLLASSFSHLTDEEVRTLPKVSPGVYGHPPATSKDRETMDDDYEYYQESLGAYLDVYEPGSAKEWYVDERRGAIAGTLDELILSARLRRSARYLLNLQLESTYARSRDAEESILQEVLHVMQRGYAGTVVSLDLKAVVLRLDAVPLDEVFDFKKQNASELKDYLRQIGQYLVLLGTQGRDGKEQLIRDRREELFATRESLMRTSRIAFNLRREVPFLFGMTGAIISGFGGEPLGLAGGAIGALSALPTATSPQIGPYQYLFSAEQRWKAR